MEPKTEAGVDGARSAANRVRAALERAKAIKKESMQINEQDEWMQSKRSRALLRDANQVEQETVTAYKEVSECRRAVREWTNGHVDASATLAQRTVERAYRQANKDVNTVSTLLYEVRQIFVDIDR